MRISLEDMFFCSEPNIQPLYLMIHDASRLLITVNNHITFIPGNIQSIHHESFNNIRSRPAAALRFHFHTISLHNKGEYALKSTWERPRNLYIFTDIITC